MFSDLNNARHWMAENIKLKIKIDIVCNWAPEESVCEAWMIECVVWKWILVDWVVHVCSVQYSTRAVNAKVCCVAMHLCKLPIKSIIIYTINRHRNNRNGTKRKTQIQAIGKDNNGEWLTPGNVCFSCRTLWAVAALSGLKYVKNAQPDLCFWRKKRKRKEMKL